MPRPEHAFPTLYGVLVAFRGPTRWDVLDSVCCASAYLWQASSQTSCLRTPPAYSPSHICCSTHNQCYICSNCLHLPRRLVVSLCSNAIAQSQREVRCMHFLQTGWSWITFQFNIVCLSYRFDKFYLLLSKLILAFVFVVFDVLIRCNKLSETNFVFT